MRTLTLALLLAAPAFAQDPAQPAPTATPSGLDPLEAAFQKEYAYLVAERNSLQNRLTAQRREAERARAASNAQLDGLEARLTALQIDGEQATAVLADVERAAGAVQEADDTVEVTWFQARTDLTRPGFELADVTTKDLPGYAEGFSRAFTAAAGRMAEQGAVRRVVGDFFDAEGKKVDGDLLTAGDIATWGLPKSGAPLALVPVGDGTLRAWKEGGGGSATELLAKQAGHTMGVFLHEGREKRVEEPHVRTWTETRELAGTVGDAILILGAVALVLIVLRVLGLLLAGRGAAVVDRVIALVEKGDLEGAQREVAKSGGSAAKVLQRMLPHAGSSRESLEDIAREALLTESPRIERFGQTIVVISTVAPLVGLLGTVSGIITTFEAITRFGNSDPKLLSGGISEALIATEFGLGVAIPSLLIGHVLLGWGHSLLARAENAALRLINATETAREETDIDPVGDSSDGKPHLVRGVGA